MKEKEVGEDQWYHNTHFHILPDGAAPYQVPFLWEVRAWSVQVPGGTETSYFICTSLFLAVRLPVTSIVHQYFSASFVHVGQE